MSDQDQIYALAFAEGTRALDNQAATVDQVRVRAAGVLTTATVASVFLVGIVAQASPEEQDLLYWALVVIGAALYAGLLFFVVAVQLPRYEWDFHLRPAVIVESYADGNPPASLSETHRGLSMFVDQNIRHNQTNLNGMHRLLAISLVLLVLEIAAWAILVAKTA